jgi:hypothetical protein
MVKYDEFEPEDPEASWMSKGKAPNRNMSLLEKFTYWDWAGKPWEAPKGSEVDGASIPWPLWSIVGSPYTGCYRRASILHDVACDNAHGDFGARRKADWMYYCACRRGGCSIGEAIIQYLGVTIGSWASRIKPLKIYSEPIVERKLTNAKRRQLEITDVIIIGTYNELLLGVQQYLSVGAGISEAAEQALFKKVQAEAKRQLDRKTMQLKGVG